MKKAEIKVLRNNEQQIENELVLKEEKIYILKDKRLRLEIIQLHYDMLIAKYKEQQKTVELVTRNYQQLGVTKEAKQYMVERYNQYQRMKNRMEIPAGKLRPNTMPEKLQQYILVDFIIKLPVSRDHNSILVVYDRFLKMSYFIITIEKIIAEKFVRLFRDNM